MTIETSEPKSVYGKDSGYWVYCGTYHKYNCGSIKGEWLNLADFTDKDDFLSYCKKLHSDESDPEYMFQDYEGFPKEFYSESGIDDRLFELLDLDERDREIVEIYLKDYDIRDFQEIVDNFCGEFDSLADYVQDYWEQCGDYKPKDIQWWHPANYTDWEKMGHDLELNGDIRYVEVDGKVWIWNSF